jgi:hypothetical protein
MERPVLPVLELKEEEVIVFGVLVIAFGYCCVCFVVAFGVLLCVFCCCFALVFCCCFAFGVLLCVAKRVRAPLPSSPPRAGQAHIRRVFGLSGLRARQAQASSESSSSHIEEIERDHVVRPQ